MLVLDVQMVHEPHRHLAFQGLEHGLQLTSGSILLIKVKSGYCLLCQYDDFPCIVSSSLGSVLNENCPVNSCYCIVNVRCDVIQLGCQNVQLFNGVRRTEMS
jgi:hypothetical protein